MFASDGTSASSGRPPSFLNSSFASAGLVSPPPPPPPSPSFFFEPHAATRTRTTASLCMPRVYQVTCRLQTREGTSRAARTDPVLSPGGVRRDPPGDGQRPLP